MDDVFNLPPIPTMKTYKHECQYRVWTSESKEMAVCKPMSLEAGHTIGVPASACNQCQAAGAEPNEVYIEEQIVSALKAYITLASKGHYEEEEKIVDLVNRAYQHFTTNSDLVYLMKMMVLISTEGYLGRVKFDELMKAMPELSLNSVKEATEPTLLSERAKAGLDGPPASGCAGCKGMSPAYTILNERNLTLTGVDGKPVLVPAGGIQSLRPSNLPQFPDAPTLVHIGGGESYLVKELPQEINQQAEKLALEVTAADQEAKSIFDKMKNAVAAGKKVGRALLHQADEATILARQNKCDACKYVDSKGDRLFRKAEGSTWYTCGKPATYEEVANNSRDIKKEGCGCWLTLKWKGGEEECPRGEW